MSTIQVALGSRSYPIEIGNGLLSQTGAILQALQLSQNTVVVSSKRILSLHGEPLFRSLRRAALNVAPVVIPEGERHKTLATVDKIYHALSRLRVNRKTLVIAFGGGVVGDIAGFAAASYLRGLPCVQVPTTLLAQIDSAIGGKTGVNLPSGKNLVGVFHQPRAVIVDPLLLSTLPPRELRSGLYEAVKYGVIRSSALLDLVAQKHSRFPQRDKQGLEQMITECARIKAEIVSQDETESELRMILNYGHTLGHALEAATHYKRLTHGEAIGHGMIMANQLAERLNNLEASEAARINAAVQHIAPLPSLRQLRWNEVYRHMLADKKFVGQSFRFVLPRRVGHVDIVKDVPRPAVESVLRSYLHAQS
ncbi:MAG: 3-dehydroquinate synthase [Acidobacteria bacterium]|nr:3-dehydroquinate synthase [Acidobacteriota bacterium]